MTESSPSTSWQPPSGFTPVASLVEGISVFAPQADAPTREAQVTYKCPNCGATTRFNVEAGGVACEHCGYTAPIQGVQVGRGAQQYEFKLETLEQAAQGWGVPRNEIHCESCGANITLDAGSLTVTCPFCASNRVNARPAPTDELRPRFLIPFKIQPEENRQRLSAWLGKGWFHPDGLSVSAVVDRFTGIYLPFFTFDAAIGASWKAEVGYEHQERYYDAADKTWKTRTEIRWRWENGQTPVRIDDLLTCGSSRLSRRILQRIYPFSIDALVDYSPDYLAGWQAQSCDINLPEAWESAKAEMRETAKEACYADINSPHVRNFSMLADFADETWRYVLLPVYLASYRFEDRVYQVMVNGQTGAVAGQKPVAWWKVWIAIVALLAPGLLTGLISLPLFLVGGLGVFSLVIAFALLLIGGSFAVGLYRKAVESEAG